MRISELKEKKITRRATRDFDADGNRIYDFFEYDLPYKNSLSDLDKQREVAKIIDMLIFFLIFLFLFKKDPALSFLYSIPGVIITGSITEVIWGNTLGKKLFRMKVIDDFGNYPDFFTSLKRNFLCLANFYPSFSEHTSTTVAMGTQTRMRTNMSMYMNNEICKTYIVKEKKMIEIRSMLALKSAENNGRLIGKL
ncbi:RDD family protein [Chryseobacterium sp. SN22]|uniref:RDD family protein n=1 Tax=Chryseobacterium sp. SN22 TaxID=2606431 RepID=UPI00162ABB36|nr:RDD family protein [Chryseobacterium sp. SN22]